MDRLSRNMVQGAKGSGVGLLLTESLAQPQRGDAAVLVAAAGSLTNIWVYQVRAAPGRANTLAARTHAPAHRQTQTHTHSHTHTHAHTHRHTHTHTLANAGRLFFISLPVD